MRWNDLTTAQQERAVKQSIRKNELVVQLHEVGNGGDGPYRRGCRCFECRAVRATESRLYYKSSKIGKSKYLRQRIDEDDESYRRRIAYAETEPENYRVS